MQSIALCNGLLFFTNVQNYGWQANLVLLQTMFGSKRRMQSIALCDGLLFYYNLLMKKYVYILELSDKTFYVGSTPRLEDRIIDHKEGKCLSTKDKRPLKLFWYCCFNNEKYALNFEKYLKGGSGTAFRHKHLE